jgi:hypothetical protein
MTTIEDAINWMDLDKRCGGYAGHCLKCDAVLQRKFDTAESETRNSLAAILCSCTLEDFERHQPLLWLVALLNTARYEQFVANIAKRAPYSRERAWQIIRLSEHNKGNWCFVLEPYRKALFKPRFHLHPTIVPLLLAATVGAGTEEEDGAALLEYFQPIVDMYPVLKNALPLWREEQARREAARAAEWARQANQKRIEDERLRAEEAARERQYRAIEVQGTDAILCAIRDADTLGASCPLRWASLPETTLRTVCTELLEEVARSLSGRELSRSWRGLNHRIIHLIKSQVRAKDRIAHLQQLENMPLLGKLNDASDSRWSLTYFPETWADEVIQQPSSIPKDLRWCPNLNVPQRGTCGTGGVA